MNDVLAWLAGLVAIVLPGFGATPTPGWNGYVEADYVYVSAVTAGPIETMSVGEGDEVAAGDVLFALRQDRQAAAVRGAEARVAAARAGLDNLTTGGRSAEIDVIRASLNKAVSELSLAQTTATRTEDLFAKGVATRAQLDQANASLESAKAAVAQYTAQLKVAELPARDAQQAEAEANVAAAEADADAARATLDDMTVKAPVAGRIERIYFDAGEVAGAGAPVLAILPAGALKVKFYLPEAARNAFRLGDEVAVGCDGCPSGLTAKLSWFASDPEFTPPIIYSRDERQRLTFLAEATLAADSALHPGQPVSVERLP
jgi:HlyD family secretion protein